MNRMEMIFLFKAMALGNDRQVFSLFFHYYNTRLVRLVGLFVSRRSGPGNAMYAMMGKMSGSVEKSFILERSENRIGYEQYGMEWATRCSPKGRSIPPVHHGVPGMVLVHRIINIENLKGVYKCC